MPSMAAIETPDSVLIGGVYVLKKLFLFREDLKRFVVIVLMICYCCCCC